MAQEYIWTGGGADARFTNAANWGGETVFTQNWFALIRNNVNSTILLPKGAYGQVSGFDISNVQITIAGKVDSFTTETNARYNGFWMRGNATVTFLPTAEYNMLLEEPIGDWKGTDAQLTMVGGNNTIHKQDNGTLAFNRMFISGHDGAGYNNIFNHHAGTVTANELWIGTTTSTLDTNPSQYNLYGGTVYSLVTGIQHHSFSNNDFNGLGELNIYGGTFTTRTLSGGQSTFDGGATYYFGDINLHLGEASAEGFGTFMVEEESSYNGKVNVLVDSPLLTLSPDIAGKNLVNFRGNVDANMQFTTNSSLIAIAEDKKTASLDTSKNVTPTEGYMVGDFLSFETAVAGYLQINPSSDPYTMLLSTTAFASEEAIVDFANWLNEEVENYSVTPSGLDSLKLETLAAGSDAIFLWDFSGYSTEVGVWGISTQHVPEPHSWVLAILGIAFYWGRSYAQRRFYAG